LHTKTQTGNPRGTYKFGDKHPFIANRYFKGYSNGRELWQTLDGIIKCAKRQNTTEFSGWSDRPVKGFLQTGNEVGTYSYGDPHPLILDRYFCGYSKTGSENWFTSKVWEKIKPKEDRLKLQTGNPVGTYKYGDQHPTIKGRVFNSYRENGTETWFTSETWEKVRPKCGRKKRVSATSDDLRKAKIYIEQWGMTPDEAAIALRRITGREMTGSTLLSGFKRDGISPNKKKITTNQKRQCKLCVAYFVKGLSTDDISSEVGLSKNVNASEMLRDIWPDFDFTGYATMRRHKIRPWTQVRDEEGNKIKKWHIEDGFGSEVISERLGISKGQCLQILRSFDWYDPNKAKAHLSMRKLGTKRKGGVFAVKPEWKIHQERIEKKRRSKRTRAINDLPLFDFAARERAREKDRNKPRTHADREREMNRYYSDPVFWVKQNCRKRLNKFVTKTQKVRGFENYTGCTPDELRDWLESQFSDWMSWSNKGKWHIDHIVPCASFDLSDKDQQKVCFNWRNLQPLERRKNISKGDDINESVIHIKTHPRQDVMDELVKLVSPFVHLPLS